MIRLSWGAGRRRFRRYVDDITERWLGWTMPPAGRARLESSWDRDDPDAYCPRCGGSVGWGEASETGCASCRDRPTPADGVVRLGAYRDTLRDWILSIKYHGWSEMGDRLGRELGLAVMESMAQHRLERDRLVVVPMPMPWQRRLYRGIDHARILADGVGAGLQAPVAEVLRRSNGPPQVSLATSRRRRVGTIGISPTRRIGGWDLRDLDVLVVDDVLTTGATMRSSVRVLRRFRPRRVVAAVVAVSDDRARRSGAGTGSTEDSTQAGHQQARLGS